MKAVQPLYGEREATAIAYLTAGHLQGFDRFAAATYPSAAVNYNSADERAIGLLAAGMPVQYVTGTAFFAGREFAVDTSVLIPRPETEELVRWALRLKPDGGRLLDAGTGSGCIAVTLAAEAPASAVTAVDISAEALSVARYNAARNVVDVWFRQADILAADLLCGEEGTFDMIVSNPPYVPLSDREGMHDNVSMYEPSTALFVPDDDPLMFYRALMRHGKRLLVPGGWLLFEIYELYGRRMSALAAAEGFAHCEVRRDIHGRERMFGCREV